MKPATDEDLDEFNSLRGRHCPPGYFIGDGEKAVRRMIRHGVVEKILCSPDWVDEMPRDLEIRVAPREVIDRISGLKMHQRLMALAKIPPPQPIRGTFLVALDGVSNAENVGAVLRTSAALGVDGFIVDPTSASPWLRRAVRVSMVAGLVVPVHEVPDVAETIRPLHAWAAHLYGERKTYTDVDFTKPCCLVLGGEAVGVTERVLQACRGAVYIPMASQWDCLNVAASAAVVLAEVARQRRPAST